MLWFSEKGTKILIYFQKERYKNKETSMYTDRAQRQGRPAAVSSSTVTYGF